MPVQKHILSFSGFLVVRLGHNELFLEYLTKPQICGMFMKLGFYNPRFFILED